MIHPDTYIAKTNKGIGVFAKRKFSRGEILWITDEIDVKIPLHVYEQFDQLQKSKLDMYSYEDYEKRVIIPWDEGKYVNHSCSPNSTSLLQFDNISIAMHDIEKDEEMTEDYYSYFAHFESFVCSCGSPNCRKYIKHDDTYDADLRLDLGDVAGLILSQPQCLLEIHSKEAQNFKAFLQSFVRKNGTIATVK